MLWKPKPSNWRVRYWHRPVSLAWAASDHNINIDRNYIDWLAGARGWSSAEARAHVAATQKPCGLISVHHGGPKDEVGRQQLAMF